MRSLVVIALVACTPPTAAPRDAAPARDAPRPDAGVDAAAFSMKGIYAPVIIKQTQPPTREPVVPNVLERVSTESRPAIHGAAITNVAVTDEGRTAVSVDGFGAVRLWPTLDGRVEPVVVTASHPAQLAIARDGDHFVIAALDRGGTLEFLTVKPTGASLWHTRIDEPRPIVSIAATVVGFVAVTDDQRIATFSLDGGRRDQLVPDPGEHIVGIVHRGVRALALVSANGVVYGRWVTNDGWAGKTPRLMIDPSHAALTSDGTRLAGVTESGISIVSTETGKELRVITNTNGTTAAPFPAGFVDAEQLAAGDGFSVFFARGAEIGPWQFGDERPIDGVVVGDGVAVVGNGASLVIATPAGGAKILGYRLAMPTELRILDHGAILGDGATLIRIDDRLAERERYTTPPDVWNVVPLDTHHALAFARDKNTQHLVALDLDDPDATKILVRDGYGSIVYQPATHLYAVVASGHIVVGRFDPRASTFDDPIQIPLDQQSSEVLLPERGAPLVYTIVRPDGRGEVREVAKLDFAKHAFTAGASHKRKPSDPYVTQRPPDRAQRGALVAELTIGRITLRDGDTLRWVVPSHGVSQLAWSARGDLVAMGNGITHLDLATGAFTGAHCGFGFGLWEAGVAQASRFASGLESVCDVE